MFLAHVHFLGEYTCIFVMQMIYDILFVGVVVYDMQVRCACVLFEVPLKFMTLGTVFAIMCMNMDFVYM